ncbi:hypothetical protein BB987_08140 [Photorhabdus temperata]|nr:DUF637 domain-containing protein [Photorhabdus khanii]OHV55313.1 hypothetical protein BB987_08140 [Photorhabdus temperata]
MTSGTNLTSGSDMRLSAGGDVRFESLLNHIGNQMNAEGAKLIGDNGETLGVPGKTAGLAAIHRIKHSTTQ